MKKIVLCENCESVMTLSKTSSKHKKAIKEKIDSYLDAGKSKKEPDFSLEVWKCDCPKKKYIIHLLE